MLGRLLVKVGAFLRLILCKNVDFGSFLWLFQKKNVLLQ